MANTATLTSAGFETISQNTNIDTQRSSMTVNLQNPSIATSTAGITYFFAMLRSVNTNSSTLRPLFQPFQALDAAGAANNFSYLSISPRSTSGAFSSNSVSTPQPIVANGMAPDNFSDLWYVRIFGRIRTEGSNASGTTIANVYPSGVMYMSYLRQADNTVTIGKCGFTFSNSSRVSSIKFTYSSGNFYGLSHAYSPLDRSSG